MENTTKKNGEGLNNKHPEPSANVQMDIETVIPDTEALTTGKDTEAKQEKENKANKEEIKESSSTEETDHSSVEKDNTPSAE